MNTGKAESKFSLSNDSVLTSTQATEALLARGYKRGYEEFIAEEWVNSQEDFIDEEWIILQGEAKAPKVDDVNFENHPDIIPRSEFSEEEVVDREHGIVRYSFNNEKVIVKPVREDTSHEVDFLKMFVNSDKIVGYRGVCTNPPGLVMEDVPGGSLQKCLRELRLFNAMLQLAQILAILFDVAEGMETIHAKDVVHGDLHHGNILVTEDLYHAKIGDFGLSREGTISTPAGVLYHDITAPELWKNHAAGSKMSDVFAFAIIMWEMLANKMPYGDMPGDSVIQMVMAGDRLPVPSFDSDTYSEKEIETYERLAALMTRCWSQDPAARPSFSEIKDSLTRL